MPRAPMLIASLALLIAGDALAGPGDGRNDPARLAGPSVVLISIDGYGWDYPERFPSPAIDRLIEGGVRAERLLPAWPTMTFPNHYTLVTGLTPAHHGLVNNEFPRRERTEAALTDDWYALGDRDAVMDGSWYGGEPIWVTAEKQGLVAASYFWVGSEADVQGIQPSHWYPYDGDVPNSERVTQVLAWLNEPPETRPRMITLYFEDVDGWGHYRGIGSFGFQEALADVDQALGELLDGIDALPEGQEVYIALVSDHGQLAYNDTPPFILGDHIDLEGLAFDDSGPFVMAWQHEPDPAVAAQLAATVNAAWDHGTAHTRATAPAAWQLNDNPRMPDLVFQADAGYAVLSTPGQKGAMTQGDHGWAETTAAMQGTFIVRGPGIGAGKTIAPIRSVDVYPMLLEWLDLDAPAPLDGVPPELPGQED